jgi:hypothetical protein
MRSTPPKYIFEHILHVPSVQATFKERLYEAKDLPVFNPVFHKVYLYAP